MKSLIFCCLYSNYPADNPEQLSPAFMIDIPIL